ncbi:MAG TPA: hybrid sensor histidine kinase/response regulator, partial [Pyrinomonadaceae bacterium]|nr:hybrid sensor histidine kinase/response regulator [Pyrinomonadaceae bacterium]
EVVNSLLANLNLLEALLDETVTALRAKSLTDAGNSFENFEGLAGQPEMEVFSGGEGISDEELDPEMLEVFAEEAGDLLGTIGENIQRLEQNAQNKSALDEIRRCSHTLKGAAGVCGFRTVSSLAHRMEDLLDYLAGQPAASNSETTALILTSADTLERLTRCSSENVSKDEIERLYARFDSALSKSESESEIQISLPAQNYEPDSKQQTDVVAIAHENLNIATPPRMPSPPPPAQPSTAATRTVVRVGLERLDELVKLTSEIIISRNSLEQRLAQVESQLSELNRSTSRLRRIAAKLEIDYESSALSSAQNSLTSLAPFFSAGSLPNVAALKTDAPKYGFDELEFDRYTEFHQLTRELAETATDTAGIGGEMNDLVSNLEGLLSRQRRTTEEIQEKLRRLRMLPLSSLAPRLERTVRVTAEQENKLVDFILEDAEIEIDTQVLDSLAEPLLHLLRNSISHGIETADKRFLADKPARGTIYLNASHEGTHIVINISDDGGGINTARLREKAVENGFMSQDVANALCEDEAAALVFLPGLSTAKEVSEVSGRGVGMDIVRESVERQQGTITLNSELGQGTTITIRLPVSMSVSRALLIKSYDSTFAIPVGMISQLTEVTAEDFSIRGKEKCLRINDHTYPTQSLNALLGLPELAERDSPFIPTLICNTSQNPLALTFDQTIDAREIVIKPFDSLLRQVRGLLGATLLGDGAVIPVLDLFALIDRETTQTTTEKAVSTKIPVPKASRLTVMIVDDSPSVRRVMTNLITKSGWDVLAAKDGLEALEMLQTARVLPHVILSDVEMPRMDGYEFVATLKQQDAFRNIPVVMITSRAGDKHRRKAFEMGVAEYLTKPYQDTVLLEMVKRLSEV